MTVPVAIVRRWGIVPGDELLIRSTEQGILLAPRWVKTEPQYQRTASGERRRITSSASLLPRTRS